MGSISTIKLPNNSSYDLKDARISFKSTSSATNSSNTITDTSGRQYAVVKDKDGYLSVNVPWIDDELTSITNAEIDELFT